MPEKASHWTMTYARRELGDTKRYVVFCGPTRLQFDSKPSAIAEAQRRNEYEPVDGSEQTYGEQIRAEGRR